MSEVWLVDIVGKVDVGVGLVDMGGKGRLQWWQVPLHE